MHTPRGQAHGDAGEKGLLCPVEPLGPHVLGHEGAHGLHEGSGNEHDEAADFLRHPDGGRRREADAVHDGHDEKERQPHQQVLQGDGETQFHDAEGRGPMEADHGQGEGERKSPLFYDDIGNHHRQGLGSHGGEGCSGGALVEESHQQEIAEGIENRSDGHGHERGLRVPDAPEQTADEVVADDDHHAAAADADIGHRLFKSLGRRIHPSRKGGGEDGEAECEEQAQQQAEADAASRNGASLLSPARPYVLAQEDGDAHGEAGGEHGKGLENLGPRGHGGHIGGTGKMAHDEKIHRPVEGLQQQGPHDRQGKPEKGPRNGTGRKVMGQGHGSSFLSVNILSL